MATRLVRRSTRVLVSSCVILLAAWQGATGPSGAAAKHSRSQPRLTGLALSPTATDPQLSGPDDPNLTILGPRSSWNGLLLVFLPGSGGQPACCRLFLDEAATLGYHAVGLTDDNTVAVGTRCLNDLACYGEVRMNVFDGADPSAPTAVVPEDGVEHRLEALLTTLPACTRVRGGGRLWRTDSPSIDRSCSPVTPRGAARRPSSGPSATPEA